MTTRYIPKVGDEVEVSAPGYLPDGTFGRVWLVGRVDARSMRGVSVRLKDDTRLGVEIDRIRPRKTEEDSR